MSDFRERYEQWKKTGSWGDTSAVSSFRANYYNKKAETAAADIESRVNTWLENNKNFIDNYNYRYGSGNENYRADSAEWLSTVTAQKANFDAEAENIKTLLGHYKDYLNEDYVSEITNALDGNGRLQAQIVSASESDGKYWAQWGSEDEYNSWLQQREEIESILNADDFEEYFSAGESKKEREKWWKGIENNVAYLRDPANLELYESSANSANGASWGTVENTLLDKLDYKAAKYMKDDEYKVYNYYVGKGETEKAEAFLKSLEDRLTRRQAGELVSDIKGNALKEAFFAVESGLDQFWSGIGSIDNLIMGTEADPPSATQMASPEIRAGIDGIGGIAYELAQTTANMFPSILVGAVTGGAGGALTMGTSATGNAYAEMRNLGYDEWQSRGYAALVGVSETALQYLLGGISKLGGGSKGIFQTVASKLIPKFDNAIARVAIELGGNVLDEGLEEAIQTVLEPAFKALTTGEDFDAPKWEDVFYSALLGALSAGVLEGVPTIVETSAQTKQARDIYGADAQALVNEALEIDPENAHAQRMGARLDQGKDLSGYQLNRLAKTNEEKLVSSDMTAIQNAAEQRLLELGETENVSEIAKALAKQAAGQNLTRAEKKIISGGFYAERVANELDPGNIQSGEYSSSWAENLNTNRINAEEYGRLLAEMEDNSVENTATRTEAASITPTQLTEAAQKDSSTNPVSEAENAAESEFQTHFLDEVTSKEAKSDTDETELTLEKASEKYGAQAKAMLHTYKKGQDIERYDSAYKLAYDMGKSGVSLSYAIASNSTSYLNEKQREFAWQAGKAAADTSATEQDAKNKEDANGKKGRRKGTVKGHGVKIADLKSTFNDTQGVAYRLLSTYAEVTGIDIALYKSEANAEGKFEGAQGSFKWADDTIYIDVNAGLSNVKSVNDLAKYAMLRTFSHEFCHFIEKWNPVEYNEFRKAVFDTLTNRGENVHDLIEQKQALDTDGKMTYEKASREVVAEAMTDILPDSNFVQNLAEKHKSIFGKLLEKLKEFAADLKQYFASIGHNRSKEANALKEQVGDTLHYVDNIVKMFDRIAAQAVENYQKTVAVDEVTKTPAKIQSTVTENIDNNANSVNEITTEVKNDAEKRAEENDERRTTERDEGSLSETRGRAQTENGDRSRVSETVGEAGSGRSENDGDAERQSGSVDDTTWLLDVNNHITPEAGSELYEAKRAIEEEYGARCCVVKKSVWSRENPACAGGGIIFVSEGIDSDTLRTFVSHETTHVMKQRGFRPYLDFIENTYDALKCRSNAFRDLMNTIAKHRGFGPFDMTDEQNVDFYDELNAFVYGLFKSGIIENTADFDYAWIEDAFEDFDAHIRELSEIHEQFKKENMATKKTGVEENAEEKETRTVLPNRSDGKGTSRLPAESQTEDVSGDGTERNAVDDARERGGQTRQSDHRPDAKRDERGYGEGSSESGDLRRDDKLSDSATDTNVGDKSDEKLHAEVAEKIEQVSTETPKGRNFVIGDSLDLPNGEKARYKANVEAIRLVKRLEAEKCYATEAEQTILSKYVGWGGLANAFDARKADWSREFNELKEILTDEEYSSARGSTLNAHYTDISVIKAMYDGLAGLGFNGGRMLEPSSGVGNFVGAMPLDMSAKVKSWTMVELDGITGLIAKYLYPNADVRIQGFEKANIPNNFMDVAISNVPFGNYAITDKAYPKKVTSAIHNYFFAKTLDKVRPGGIVMFITSSYTMNSKDTTVRRYIMGKADLLGAIRLPETAFKGNAGTEVVTDILIFKKRAAGTPYAGENFLEAPWGYPVKGNYNGAYINDYFTAHPEMVLGTPSMEGSMYRGASLTYKPLTGKGILADQIREAFSHVVGKMDYPVQITPERANFAAEKATKKTKENGLVVKDGKQSFSRFKNLGELQLLFRNFADVLTDIPGLKIPKMKGGKVNVVVCEPGQYQKDYMKALELRADSVKNVDPSVDNMLKITSDGRKISYTQRMILPSLPYEEGCKIYRCADNVIKTYNESGKIKGTQLIFCDMATPKGKSKTETVDIEERKSLQRSIRKLPNTRNPPRLFRLKKNHITIPFMNPLWQTERKAQISLSQNLNCP